MIVAKPNWTAIQEGAERNIEAFGLRRYSSYQ
nr:MAG TPA: hypothetical protein [Caudoviricetes sp.]